MNAKTLKACKTTERELDKACKRIHKLLNYGAIVKYSDEYNALDALQSALESAIGKCSLAIDPVDLPLG